MPSRYPMSLPQLGDFLEDHLLNFIMPFWLKHAIDEKGGINTCIKDDGTIITHDKLMWSQLRAIYTFSALYNRIEKKQQWLDIASQLVEFTSKHGRNDKGEWIFRVDREGRQVEGPISIYVDGFALQGLSEYLNATNDSAARKLALETFDNMNARFQKPGSYASAPYPIREGLKAHGVSMIGSYAFHELAKVTGEKRVKDAALHHALQVMDHYRKPEIKALLEFVKLDGSRDDSPEGRTCVPGHAIESMWFQIHQFRDLGGYDDRIRQAIECMKWHMELGWDKKYGGLLLGLDIEGKEPIYWKFHDTKLWWPVTEAMYAMLLAHSISGEQWCLDWYWKVHEVGFKHYPVHPHGEWTQKLDRQFNKIDTVVALPVKDPFHLPRALILCIELLRGMKV